MVTRTRGETRRQQWARGKCRYSPLVGVSSLLQFSSLTSKQVSTFEILLKKSPRFQNIWTFLLLTVLSIRLYRTAHLKTSHDPKDTPVMFRNFRISQFVLTEIPTGKPLLHKAVQCSGTVWKSNYTNWCYSLLALVIEDYLCLHFILQISFVWFLFLFFFFLINSIPLSSHHYSTNVFHQCVLSPWGQLSPKIRMSDSAHLLKVSSALPLPPPHPLGCMLLPLGIFLMQPLPIQQSSYIETKAYITT